MRDAFGSVGFVSNPRTLRALNAPYISTMNTDRFGNCNNKSEDATPPPPLPSLPSYPMSLVISGRCSRACRAKMLVVDLMMMCRSIGAPQSQPPPMKRKSLSNERDTVWVMVMLELCSRVYVFGGECIGEMLVGRAIYVGMYFFHPVPIRRAQRGT